MAKPRIFISSTFYDLKQIRTDLDRFIKEMGYESVRNEQGNIPYGKEEKLEEYCYKEISFVDILISIVGGKFGSTSTHQGYSISQVEINTALKLDKQVFIFIDKNVYGEYRTYLANKENHKVKYHFVDNVKIYQHIEFLEALPKNNPIHGFESSEDIISFLKEQWSGLFQRFLQEKRRQTEIGYLQGLENTANTLNQLIQYLAEDKKDKENTIRDLLLSNHPMMDRIKRLLGVTYRVFFLSKDELKEWLKARNYLPVDKKNWDKETEEEFVQVKNGKQNLLKIAIKLFDKSGNLISISKEDWKDDFVRLETTDIKQDDDDDLPF